MFNPKHNTTVTYDPVKTPIRSEVIDQTWPKVLARFTVIASVESLIRKKERELKPNELVIFMDAAIRRIEELS
ncbi:TPA: hypothetical protein QCH65_004427 [Enterobacter roggenkampii]|nr:hypothetical protein [Enterobacter roggenkampii]